jgi:hypothetical protein
MKVVGIVLAIYKCENVLAGQSIEMTIFQSSSPSAVCRMARHDVQRGVMIIFGHRKKEGRFCY